MEFLREIWGRWHGVPSESSVRDLISTLEKDFTGITLVELVAKKWTETAEEAQQPVVGLTLQTIDVARVPGVVKPKGQTLTAHLVVKPVSGLRTVIGLINAQKDEEIQPGGTLRFFIPDQNQRVLAAAGTGEIYVRVDGKPSRIFGINVPWGVVSKT